MTPQKKQILLLLAAMAGGALFGALADRFGFSNFVFDWITPLGQDLFIRSLKLIAIPLIVVSLLSGFSELRNLTQLSRLGVKTAAAYLCTTVLAITLGLLLANLIRPGAWIDPATRLDLNKGQTVDTPAAAEWEVSLRFLDQLIPENLVSASSSNANMLQVILVIMLFAVALMSTPADTHRQLAGLFRQLNTLVMKVIDLIMWFAPIGVFALIADIAAQAPGRELVNALGVYALTVVLALAILLLFIYPLLAKWLAGVPYSRFLRDMLPVQLMAFSTSSSAATLPLTLQVIQQKFGVGRDTAGFVAPIGATVNMDGTAAYIAIAALFLAQAFGMELSWGAQLSIVVTATLASIGAAAVPGAGLIMLTIVLEQARIPAAGLALILALDRPLDMLRTSVNVTSDAALAIILDRRQK